MNVAQVRGNNVILVLCDWHLISSYLFFVAFILNRRGLCFAILIYFVTCAINMANMFLSSPRRFMVDWVPIRVYRNHADKGVAFPRWQPMSIKASLWNGDSWATRGGLDKVDWSKGPFIASFRKYKIDACIWRGNPRFCRVESSTNWWNKERHNTLTWAQRRLFKWVRKYHLTYDYCQDNKRFQDNLPKECSLPKY